jgi:hypothetical protein
VHELATKAEGATTSSSRTRPIPTTEPGPGLGTPDTSRSGFPYGDPVCPLEDPGLLERIEPPGITRRRVTFVAAG